MGVIVDIVGALEKKITTQFFIALYTCATFFLFAHFHKTAINFMLQSNQSVNFQQTSKTKINKKTCKNEK